MKQRGMILMALLACLIAVSLGMLLTSLTPGEPTSQRNLQSARVLGEVKRVLLGRAAMDASLPGSLPCPDSNGDGSADLLVGNDCPSYLGRLPYKTLGIPEPLDGTGETLWYALSRRFRDDNSNNLNSDSSGDLNLNGLRNVSGLAAVLFAPGSALPGQSRGSTQPTACQTSGSILVESLCAANYLEGSNASLNTRTTPNQQFLWQVTDAHFNDQILPILGREIVELTGKRMLRELKNCLDSYATASSSRYPWAAPVQDVTSYRATTGQYFGRIPAHPRPLLTEVADPHINALLDGLAILQLTLERHAASNTAANRSALSAAGQSLISIAVTASRAEPPPLPGHITQEASLAGSSAQELAKTPANSTTATVRGFIRSVVNNLPTAGVPLDSNMSISWPASCTHVSNAYWNYWRNEVFYRIAHGSQPGGSSCTTHSGCLQINGTGNFHAVLLLAGPALNGQASRRPGLYPPIDWLEGANQQIIPTTSLISHRHIDSAYAEINDQAICLDGRNACQ